MRSPPKLPALIGGSARSQSFDTHRAQGSWGLRAAERTRAASRNRGASGATPAATSAVRRARACDGRRRSTASRRMAAPLPFGATFLDLLRLHAAADPARVADGPARRHRLHARQRRRSARTGRRISPWSSSRACARFRGSPSSGPADANETAVAWRVAVETRDRPVALVLSASEGADARPQPLRAGGRTAPRRLRSRRRRQRQAGAILIATGSRGRPDRRRAAEAARATAFPCARSRCRAGSCSKRSRKAYRDEVLPRDVPARLAVEAGATQGWSRYVGDRGDVLGIDHFGASAPGEVTLREFGFTVENVCKHVEALL